MNFQKSLNFIIYINDLKKADSFKSEISKKFKNSNIVCVDSFDIFYLEIKFKNFDCFIIQKNLNKINSVDIIEKLRLTKKFNHSVIGFYSENEFDLKKEYYSTYRIDFVINNRTSNAQFIDELADSINNSFKNIIPENFNVLVLDDSKEITEIITSHLNEMNHEKIRTCHSVKDALEMISEFEFDLMLLDWNLPDGSCIDFIENIRLHSNSIRNKEALIIVITGRNDVEDIMTLLRYNVVDHIIKPFDFSEFQEKLIYAIERLKRDNKKKAS